MILKGGSNISTQGTIGPWSEHTQSPRPTLLFLILFSKEVLLNNGINEQVLYANTMHVLKGSHLLEYNIASFADGIYYYSMEYEGERIIKKMTIQK